MCEAGWGASRMESGNPRFRFSVLIALALFINVAGVTAALAKTTKPPDGEPAPATVTPPTQETQAEPQKEPPVSVTPIRSQPLRDIWPIAWWAAPSSVHPEPVLVEGPIDTKPPDISTMQLVPG